MQQLAIVCEFGDRPNRIHLSAPICKSIIINAYLPIYYIIHYNEELNSKTR